MQQTWCCHSTENSRISAWDLILVTKFGCYKQWWSLETRVLSRHCLGTFLCLSLVSSLDNVCLVRSHVSHYHVFCWQNLKCLVSCLDNYILAMSQTQSMHFPDVSCLVSCHVIKCLYLRNNVLTPSLTRSRKCWRQTPSRSCLAPNKCNTSSLKEKSICWAYWVGVKWMIQEAKLSLGKPTVLHHSRLSSN